MGVHIGYLYTLVMYLPMCCVSELIFWCTTWICGGWIGKRGSHICFLFLFSLLCLIKLRNYSKSLWTFYYLIYNMISMRKVDRCSNDIDLRNNFINFYENVKKKITFFFIYIFHNNGIKTFIKWYINKYFKNTY